MRRLTECGNHINKLTAMKILPLNSKEDCMSNSWRELNTREISNTAGGVYGELAKVAVKGVALVAARTVGFANSDMCYAMCIASGHSPAFCLLFCA
jgi:hypothetical protein